MNITKREQEVMTLLVRGLTNKQIAKVIGISNHTVRDHLSSLLKKFEASNRVELVATFMSHHHFFASQIAS